MRAFAYIRVSTKEQDENVQRQALEDFAKRHNITIVRWYIDKGESGAKPFRQRPAAQALLRDLNGDVDLLLAWSLDRVGRSLLDTLNTIIYLENELGVRVVTVKEEFLQYIDPSFRKLIISMLAWFAEFERKRIRERQEEAWRQGKQKGRPKKVPDEVILSYYRRYGKYNKRYAWLRMREDGYDLSYWQFLRRLRRLL